MNQSIIISRIANRTSDYYRHYNTWKKASAKTDYKGNYYTSNQFTGNTSSVADYWILCDVGKVVQQIKIGKIEIPYLRTSSAGASSTIPYIFALKADSSTSTPPCYQANSYQASISNNRAILKNSSGSVISTLGSAYTSTISLSATKANIVEFKDIIIGDGVTSFQYFWLNIKSSALTIIQDGINNNEIVFYNATNISGAQIEYYTQEGQAQENESLTENQTTKIKAQADGYIKQYYKWEQKWLNVDTKVEYDVNTTIAISSDGTITYNSANNTLYVAKGSVLKLQPVVTRNTCSVTFVSSISPYDTHFNPLVSTFSIPLNINISYSYTNINGTSIAVNDVPISSVIINDCPQGETIRFDIKGIGPEATIYNKYYHKTTQIDFLSDSKTVVKTIEKTTALTGKDFYFTPMIEENYEINLNVWPTYYRLECQDSNTNNIPHCSFTVYGSELNKAYYDDNSVGPIKWPQATPTITIDKSYIKRNGQILDQGPKRPQITYPAGYAWQVDNNENAQTLLNNPNNNFTIENLFGSSNTGNSKENDDIATITAKRTGNFTQDAQYILNFIDAGEFAELIIPLGYPRVTGLPNNTVTWKETTRTLTFPAGGITTDTIIDLDWGSEKTSVLYNGQYLEQHEEYSNIFRITPGLYTLSPSGKLTQFEVTAESGQDYGLIYIPQSCTLYDVRFDQIYIKKT